MSNDQLKKYFKLNPEEKIVNHSWECDIYSIMSELINEYNLEIPYDPGHKFTKVTKSSLSIVNLLQNDFISFTQHLPQLGELANKVNFYEVEKNTPHISAILTDKTEQFSIIASSSMLPFIHSFFSRAELLMRMEKLENCSPKYDDLALGEQYSDERLLVELLEDLESFYSLASNRNKNKIYSCAI